MKFIQLTLESSILDVTFTRLENSIPAIHCSKCARFHCTNLQASTAPKDGDRHILHDPNERIASVLYPVSKAEIEAITLEIVPNGNGKKCTPLTNG